MTAEALKERNVGALTGICKATARSTYGADVISRWKTDGEVEPLGGETMNQVGRRVHDFVYGRALCKRHADDVVLVISHSNAIKSFFNLIKVDIGFSNGSLPQDNLIVFDSRSKSQQPEFIRYGCQ